MTGPSNPPPRSQPPGSERPGEAPPPGPAPGTGAARPPGGLPPPGTGTGTWQVMLVVAVATLALGLILLLWPHASVVVVAVLIGIALLIVGVLRLLQGLTADEESGAQRAAYVIIGILAGLAGLYCLRHIDVTVSLLAFVVGLFWAMHGVVDLAVAASAGRGQGRGAVAISGVLSLAAGLIVIFWPAISLTILVAVIGAWLIFDSLLLAFMAFRLSRPVTGAGRERP